MSGSHLTKEFFELVKAIGESKSKQEEDRIITNEVSALKRKLQPDNDKNKKSKDDKDVNTNKKKAKEYLVRLMYVEMLGHDGSFGYIKAVELAAATSLIHKKTGYLTCGACLSPDHEFRFMLVNQLQRDLSSTNLLETTTALTAVCRLITSDMVPAVINEVTKLLTHQSELVRKKAIIALHRFHQLDPTNVTVKDLALNLRRVLCDKDPSVMGASLCVIEKLSTRSPAPFKDLVSSLVSILKQICEHRLPSDFDYHRMPAPWMQMKIIRILAVLGKGDKVCSEGMYEILADAMKRADTGINVGYAIMYECVKAVTAIYPNATLLDAAAEAIARFIQSSNHNLKYLGVTGLAAIVKEHPKYAAQHQIAVIECLEDPDETLQRKTLDLLFRMTNPVNVEFITAKLLSFLSSTTDEFLRQDLTLRITEIAERYAPSNSWYITAITSLFSAAGDMVNPSIAHNLMTMIAEGSGEDDDADTALRRDAVDTYTNLLNADVIPTILMETMAWILGEYAYLSESTDINTVITKLCVLASRPNLDCSTRCYLATAVMKLVSQAGACPTSAAVLIADFTKSKDVELQQRSLEFQNIMATIPHLLGDVFPVDASCEDVMCDDDLSIMNAFVQEALSNGASPYSPPDNDDDDDVLSAVEKKAAKKPMFNTTPYARPVPLHSNNNHNSTLNSIIQASASTDSESSDSTSTTSSSLPTQGSLSQAPSSSAPALRLSGVANVWGPASTATAASAVVDEKSKFDRAAEQEQAEMEAALAAVAAFELDEANAAINGSSSPSSASSVASPAPVAIVKLPAALTEREKMAMALFGGMSGSSSSPAAPVPRKSEKMANAIYGNGSGSAAAASVTPVKSAAAPTKAAPAPVVVAPVVAPVPAPVPAPAMDLLDMSFGDDDSTSHSSSNLSNLPPAPVLSFTPTELTPAPTPPAPTPPAPEAAAPAAESNIDPFSDSSIFGSTSTDTPLTGVLTKFAYNNQILSPLKIDTASFGKHWGNGSLVYSKKFSITNESKIKSLDDFMREIVTVGFHGVQAISKTHEGIAAGSLGASGIVVLVHGKVWGGGRVDVTVKAGEGGVGEKVVGFLRGSWERV